MVMQTEKSLINVVLYASRLKIVSFEFAKMALLTTKAENLVCQFPLSLSNGIVKNLTDKNTCLEILNTAKARINIST